MLKIDELPKVGDFHLMPCAANVCQECAVDHPVGQPHNQQSLYYQYKFYSQHGRWPTWADAMDHCSDDVKKVWIAELRKHGVEVPNNA